MASPENQKNNLPTIGETSIEASSVVPTAPLLPETVTPGIPPVIPIPPIITTPAITTPSSKKHKADRIEVSAQDSVWQSGQWWSQIQHSIQEMAKDGDALKPAIIELTARLRQSIAAEKPDMLLFDAARAKKNDRFVIASKEKLLGCDLWFIGDIHGDLLAFQTLIHYATEKSKLHGKEARLIFLGDLFDDGPFGHLIIKEFFELILRSPGKTAFVAGNHDVGLRFDAESEKFSSSVNPCDFAIWLNEQSADSAWRELARSAIDFFRTAPCALLLPDGTLVAHGGVPHTDIAPHLQTPSDFNDSKYLDDFIWTRAHESARRKIPNRASHGCQFGILDFQDFCHTASSVLGVEIRGLIRGHDHVAERWQFPEKYQPEWLLTINAMSWRQRDPFGPFERRPVIARWVENEVPEVHQIEIPPELIHALYDAPTAVESVGP